MVNERDMVPDMPGMQWSGAPLFALADGTEYTPVECGVLYEGCTHTSCWLKGECRGHTVPCFTPAD